MPVRNDQEKGNQFTLLWITGIKNPGIRIPPVLNNKMREKGLTESVISQSESLIIRIYFFMSGI